MSKWITWVILGLLTFGGFAVLWIQTRLAIPNELVGTLVGALWGAAAIFGGLLAVRYQARADQEQAERERAGKISSLVAAELVNIAAGMIDADHLLKAAVAARESVAGLPSSIDMASVMPRPMTLFDSLGADVLALTEKEIDVLATLRSNVALTGRQMLEITSGKRSFGYLEAKSLISVLHHDMNILAEAFEVIAPRRKLTLHGKAPELASTILKRLSCEKS